MTRVQNLLSVDYSQAGQPRVQRLVKAIIHSEKSLLRNVGSENFATAAVAASFKPDKGVETL